MAQLRNPPGLADYATALLRRRGLFIGIALPIVIVTVALALSLPDVYRSTALIEIASGVNRTSTDFADPRDEPSYADQYVASLEGIVLEDGNLRTLLDKEQLYDGQAADMEGAIGRLKGDIDVQIVTVPILDPRTGREREVVTAFNTSYNNEDPARAQKGAIWLTDQFLAANRRQYVQRAQSNAEFYRAEAERLGDTIAEQEGRLAAFKNENFGKLPELTQANLGQIDRNERDLNELQQQARGLRQDRVFLAAQLQQALAANPQAASLRQLEEQYQQRAALYDESHPDLVSLRRQIENLRRGAPAVGSSLIAQRDAQRSILAEARQRYSADHPDVKRIQQTIDALDARIAAGERGETQAQVDTPVVVQLRTQLSAIDSQLAAIDARSNDVRRRLAEVESNVVAAPEVERDYQALTRDLSTSRTKYEELLKRQMDAQISESAITAGRMDEFRVVREPLVPAAPAQPNRMLIVFTGIALAVILAFTITLGAEFLDPTVRGMRDIQEALSVTALAAIPLIQNSVSRRQQFKRAIVATAAVCVVTTVLLYVVQNV